MAHRILGTITRAFLITALVSPLLWSDSARAEFNHLQLNSSADLGQGYGASDTIGGNLIYNTYLSQHNGVSFLNSGDGPTTSIHLSTSAVGTSTYQFYYTNAFANALTLQLWSANNNSPQPDIVVSTHRDSAATAFLPIFDTATNPNPTSVGSKQAIVDGCLVTLTGFEFSNGSGPASAFSVAPGASISPEIFGQFSFQVVGPGDANGDGVVDFADLVIVAQGYGKPGGQTWATGDFTSDGNVLFDDLVLVAQNYGRGPASADPSALLSSQVPEPSLFSLLAAGAATRLVRRRNMRRD